MLTIDESKIVSMVALGLSSFFIGILPLKFSNHGRQRCPLLISILLCFGGGVLLATSIIHMLPEVREGLPDYAELLFCVGFFMVYLVDELVHYYYGETIGHNHNIDANASGLLQGNSHESNHAQNNLRQSMYGSTETHHRAFSAPERYDRQLPYNPNVLCTQHHEETERRPISSSSCCVGESSNARICHVNHNEPCNNSATGRAGLLIALSLHALLEGLAIGLQESSSKVLLLMGAVASHKLVVGFCLGLELSANALGKTCNTVVAILTFSMGSVAGIGIGMAIADQSQELSSIVLPVLQALAGGTLLYVTVCEVLPRERSRWHQKRSNPAAGLGQFAAVGTGFAAMTLINTYLGD